MTATDRPSKSGAGPARAHPSKGLSGEVRAPGDKSVSHRALILGALAEGTTEIDGLLEGADVLATAEAMRALGADVARTGPGRWRVKGAAGAWKSPAAPLDFGNSGTGCRLVMGAVAGAGVAAEFVGDESLSHRPMERILKPLRAMGAACSSTEGCLPARVDGSAGLTPIEWDNTAASAQVKSAVLLAGLGAAGRTIVCEPVLSRDHTERMLTAFGASVHTEIDADGAAEISIEGPVRLKAAKVSVPADPSSSAFLAAAALICPGSEVTITDVMANPTRDGFYDCLEAMGATLNASPASDAGGEAVRNWTIASGPLKAITPHPARAAAMIDEYPLLAVLAAFAEGTSEFRGVGELRVKESDRIAATVAMLTANGVEAEELEDGFIVHGRGAAGVPGGSRVETFHDHRIAMSALVLGLGAQAPIEVDDVSMIETSYPSFFEQMASIGACMEKL
ncbi:MAG: 3-phosphoshikimate 1-carboxyvinyltransferase [Maricaulaceae bacterium]